MRDETPDLPTDTRHTVTEMLNVAPNAVHPFLERCATDLDADDQSVRDGAAWVLGLTFSKHPEESRRYTEALEAAVQTPDQFDKKAHRKMKKALEER